PLLEEQRRDQEAAEDEEDVDAKEAALGPRVRVEEDDRQDRGGADAVQLGTVAEPCMLLELGALLGTRDPTRPSHALSRRSRSPRPRRGRPQAARRRRSSAPGSPGRNGAGTPR